MDTMTLAPSCSGLTETLKRVPAGPGYLAPLDVTVNVLVRALDTEGAWALVDYTMPPGFAGPPAHTHPRSTEAFYGLEGITTLEVEGRVAALAPGEIAVVPPGVLHRFWNASDRPARHLVLLTPAGFEAYFDDLAELVTSEGTWPPSSPEALQALMARHDIRIP